MASKCGGGDGSPTSPIQEELLDKPHFYLLVTPNPVHNRYIGIVDEPGKSHWVKIGDEKGYNSRVKSYRTDNPNFYYRQCVFTGETDQHIGKLAENSILDGYDKAGWEVNEEREWHVIENKFDELQKFCKWVKDKETADENSKHELTEFKTLKEFTDKFRDVGLAKKH